MKLVIGCSNSRRLATQLAQAISAPLITTSVRNFEDGSIYVQLNEDVANRNVVIVQSLAPNANDAILEILLTLDAIKGSAGHITLVAPYLAYSRQNRQFHEHSPISIRAIANILEAVGVDRILTLDLHTNDILKFFNIDVQNIPTHSLFKDNVTKDSIVVSPDEGGIPRAKDFGLYYGIPLAYFQKERNDSGECTLLTLHGEVKGKRCIVFDDIIASGSTLNAAIAILKTKGSSEVITCVTHNILNDEAKVLAPFYTTDSVENRASHIYTIAQLIAEKL